MYLGDEKIIHATKVKDSVVVETLEDFSSVRKVIGFGRIHENLLEERYVISVPSERLDIRIKEDLAEEVGRIIGYDTLTPTLPNLTTRGLPHKRMYYESRIKDILFAHGFSEVQTYTFGNKGEVRLLKGLADDKEKLRTSLQEGVLSALSMNIHNAPLLKTETIKIFEFGNVFTKEGESRHLALAIDDGKKKSLFGEEIDLMLSEIKEKCGLETITYNTASAKPYCIEINFDDVIKSAPNPHEFTPLSYKSSISLYKKVSEYPFIVRDIAVWTPFGTSFNDILELLHTEKNSLVMSIDCFDEFTKEIDGVKKTSFAFRVILQSYEKTLTDEEANTIADKFYSLLKGKGYEIR
jgi:phenylalanyl-tRNA synthetase beta chain